MACARKSTIPLLSDFDHRADIGSPVSFRTDTGTNPLSVVGNPFGGGRPDLGRTDGRCAAFHIEIAESGM